MSRRRKEKRRRRELRKAEAQKLTDTVGELKPKDHHLSLHHRRPKSLGGATNARNTVMIPIKMHQAYHTLFGNNEAWKIAEILNDTFIDPDYEFVCIRRE